MFFSKQIGICLRDAEERAFLEAATLACGLQPVDLLAESTEDSPWNPRRENLDLQSNVCRMRITVMDEPAETLCSPGSPAGWWAHCASLVILLRNHAGEPAFTPQEPDDYPWVLHRPLQVAEITTLLRLAVQASLAFAERSGQLFDELHRARRILDTIGSGVSISDATKPDLPLVYVNAAFERMTGYRSEEVCGHNCRFLQGEEVTQSELPKIREALREQRDVRALLKNFRKDGTPFWNELYMSPIFDFDGKLTHFAGFQNDVTARVESANQVQHLANHDSLTGLANRAFMMQRLQQALHRARRHGTIVALLFFDLNDFKQIDDSLGHEAGDRILCVVAERLVAGTRAEETAARLGGDEFVVLLEDLTNEHRAHEVLQRLSRLLGQEYELCGHKVNPSASVGMALFPRDGETPEALLKAADSRMYVAKDIFHRLPEAAEDRLKVTT